MRPPPRSAAPGSGRPPGPLFARFSGAAPDGTRLYCFPYAGGGTQMFRGWSSRVPPGVGVTGIRLPGREQRFREPALDSWPDALAVLVEALAQETGDGPYAFFGHSLGARLAYEVAHRLAGAGRRPPELLVVSACRAPGVEPRTAPMHTMDGPTLRRRLREMDGVPAEVLADRALMAVLEPTLRADLRLAETWRPSPGRIDAPILALCGDDDDIDPYEDMIPWKNHTTAGFTIQAFPAGHFFPRDEEEAVLAAISAGLTAKGAR
ncbi:thioesterase II family protein [Streptomyces sp. NPDC059070]|uniref:thioesterase II family protein n=1 Tax=Streptomyces sp. NPDC059070 TaxID=3346713 RepID=UPI00367A4388